jgi:two-component system LytT family sensor kinase
MKTRGIIDFYLPRKVALHFKIFLGSFLFALLLSALSEQGNPLNRQFLLTLFLIFIQLEVFMWLGYKFFNQKNIKVEKGYTKKVIQRLLLFYLVVLILAAIIFILVQICWYLIFDIDLKNLLPNMIHLELKGWIKYGMLGFLIGGLIFFYVQWQETLKNEQKLREEKLVFQYETIKNQVNPHFLFNSLNTLSSLINGNARAEDFIHKLSSIYRYILENRNVDQVGLEEEIEFTKNYFSLQKIRDEEKVSLEIRPVDTKKYRILPISLQLLLENALKHNSATRDHPLTITIYTEDNFIVVKNNLQKKLNIEGSPGTGLRNLGERLKLITDREMKVIETSDEFIVKIPLITT